jgi:RNA polymerase sigma-70 factor (ECF subfamily)
MGRATDRAALDRLVSGHLAEALRFAVRLTGDPQTAEEVVQEALVRVVRHWQSFRGEAHFRTWLLRIVINAFRDHLAARPRTEELREDMPDSRVADPVSQVAAGELGRLIARRVSALPPRQREVFILVTYEGLTPRQVAEMLQITEANVHATLHVARKRLRKQLAPHLTEN